MTRRDYFYFGLEASHGKREPGDARVFTYPMVYNIRKRKKIIILRIICTSSMADFMPPFCSSVAHVPLHDSRKCDLSDGYNFTVIVGYYCKIAAA